MDLTTPSPSFPNALPWQLAATIQSSTLALGLYLQRERRGLDQSRTCRAEHGGFRQATERVKRAGEECA